MKEQIIGLKRIYIELKEAYEQINKAFGWYLLANTMETFLDFTSNAYWGFMFRNVHPYWFINNNDYNIGNTGILLFFLFSTLRVF